MENQPNNHEPIKIIATLKEALFLYRDNFVLFLTISLLSSIILLFEQVLTSFNISLGWVSPITFISGLLLSFWGYIALIYATSRRYQSQDVTIKETFLKTKDKLWRFSGVSLIQVLIFVAGCLVFILPGFYLGTILGLAGFVVVLENASIANSFKQSKGLIKGYFWPVFIIFWLTFVFSLPAYLLYELEIGEAIKLLVSGLATALFVPFGVAVTTNLYQKLKQIKGDGVILQDAITKKRTGCLGCLGVIGLGIIIAILSSIWALNLGSLIKTDKGLKVYGWVAEKISPKIKLKNGAVLDRPEGYLAFGTPKDYSVMGFQEGKFIHLYITSVSFEDLGIEDIQSVKVGTGEVWDNYYYAYLKQQKLGTVGMSGSEKQSVESNVFGGRTWVEYKLKSSEDAFKTIYSYDYTVTENSILFVSYTYNVDVGEQEDPKYQEEVHRILERFRFE